MPPMDDKTILAKLTKARGDLKKSAVPAPAKADLDKKIEALTKILTTKIAQHDKLAKDIAELRSKQKSVTAALADFKAKVLPAAYNGAADALKSIQPLRAPGADKIVGELFNDVINLHAKGLNTDLTLEN